jgi:DMSO/TMAO reductase YedYZ heme-binding membrane subunit
MSAIDLSSYFGFGAITLLTGNILIGLLLSTKYNPVRHWPHRRVNTLGALALYLLIATVVTSYFRFEVGRRIWKPLHFATYALFVLYAVHGILTDPNLKDLPIDPLDGGKVYIELCVLVVIVAIGLRVRWQLRRPPPRQHRPKSSRPHPRHATADAAR